MLRCRNAPAGVLLRPDRRATLGVASGQRGAAPAVKSADPAVGAADPVPEAEIEAVIAPIVGVVALVIAWATVFAHAWRVARANPIHALRYE